MTKRLTHTAPLALLTALLIAQPARAGVETVRKANGANAAAIQATVDAFRNDLGALNAPAPVNRADGRRQINWDAAPDRVSAPNAFPGDFFNANVAPRARGIEFFTPGSGFQLSATAASGAGVEFDNLQPGLSTEFDIFSAERLFTPIGSTTTNVFFFDPVNPGTSAVVDGLGVVFTGVDDAGSTKIEFFNANGDLIASETVTPQPGPGGLSFLAVKFDRNELASARITSGSATLQVGFIGAGDTVVMDDFIFGEPDARYFAPANFASTPGLSYNARAVGGALDAIFANAATDPALKLIIGLVAGGTPGQQDAWLNQLGPEMYDTATAVTQRGGERFHEAIETRFHGGEGLYGQEKGRGTLWARSGGGIAEQDGTPGYSGYEETFFDMQGGVDFAVTPAITAGASVGFTRSDADVGRGEVEANQVTGGVYVHGEYGAFAVDGSVSYGNADIEARRRIAFAAAPGVFINRTATGHYDIDRLAGRLTGSYTAQYGATKIRPYLGVEAVRTGGADFTETGAGNLGLAVSVEDETRFSAVGGVDLSTDVVMGDMTLTPAASVGVRHHFSGHERDITARFTGAPAGSPAFTVKGESPRTVLALGLGLSATMASGIRFGARYRGEFGDGFDSHGGEAFVTIPF